MDTYGISSLQGFAYQIKVFVLKLADLKLDDNIGYEFIDDIGKFNNDNKEEIENALQNVNSKLNMGNDISVSQVKHTYLHKNDYERVLLNWILMYNTCPNISKYELIVDDQYENQDQIKHLNINNLYNKIYCVNGRKNSLESKVKTLINENVNLFNTICTNIISKYVFTSETNIDETIYDKYKSLLHHGGILESTYVSRLEELIKKMQNNILKCAEKNSLYLCGYNEFKHVVADICRGVTDEEYKINYSDFKANNNINLQDIAVVNSREYKQLLKCEFEESFIKENLIYEEYYRQFQFKKLENLKNNEIDTLQSLTFNNFYLVKQSLIRNNEDNPFERYDRTMQKENSYAPNEYVRYGSAIFLTGDNINVDTQISWGDEDENED